MTKNLICYKELSISAQTKLQFFLNKHSTKEGTWAELHYASGNAELIFLDSRDNELSRYSLNSSNKVIAIPPAAWHKITAASDDFAANLKFYCLPHRYFQKKHSLGQVHSDLLYFLGNYLPKTNPLHILDVGCGSGRNALYLALLGHQVTALDYNPQSIANIQDVKTKESLTNIDTLIHDLHEPIPLKQRFDIIISTVSLQFLKPERIPTLLSELNALTKTGGMHLLVLPVQSAVLNLPASFSYLPPSQALYQHYQDEGWSIPEYKESVGQLHKVDETGKPIQGMFGLLIASKCF